MHAYSQMIGKQRRAVLREANEKRVPFILWPEDMAQETLRTLVYALPFVGHVAPYSYKLVQTWLVDRDDPADVELLISRMRVGYAYGITYQDDPNMDAIGEYERVPDYEHAA